MSAKDTATARRRATRTQRAKPMTYTTTDALPDNAQVRLVFEGLLWFVFHGKDECQIGIHNSTHDPSHHDHQHDLDIKIWTIESGCGTGDKVCGKPKRFHLGDPKSITGIQLDINRPEQEGVYVYQKDVRDASGRLGFDERDWRWVIDLEKEPVYPSGIKLDSTKINPGISINHGVFYTLYKTTNEFELTPTDGSSDTVPFQSVALLVGANILLAKEGDRTVGDVTVVVRHQYPQEALIRRYQPLPGQCIQIDIRNTCVKGDKRCEVYGDNENDFYLYNETYTRPFGEPEYILKKKGDSHPPGPVPKEICFSKDDEIYIRSNNEAPCGPVGAGGGGGG